MKFKLRNEIQNRVHYRKFEKKILVLKYVLKNLLRTYYYDYASDCFDRELERKIRYVISTKIVFPSISKVMLVRRCVLTGRARASNRLLNISRAQLKGILKDGILDGASKYSW